MSEKQLPASSSRDAADNRPNTYGDLNLNSGRSYNTTFEKDTSHPFPHSAASGSGHFNGAQDDFLPRRQGDYSASPSSSSYINVPDSFYSLSSSNTEKPKKINISSPKYANNDIDDIFDISVLNALLPSKKPDAPLTREILRQPLLQSGSVENAKDNVTSENVIAKPDKISSPMYTSDEEQNVEKNDSSKSSQSSDGFHFTDSEEKETGSPKTDESERESESSGGFELPSDDRDENSITVKKEIQKELTEGNFHDFINKLETASKTIKTSTASEIFRQYNLFLQKLPKSVKPASIADTLTIPCCAEMCCLKFSPEFAMRSRLRIPTSTIEKVLFFQYIIIQNCITIGGNFMPQINETPICEEFFQRLYVIPKDRFDSLVEQISHGLSEPLPHGNKGKRYERSSTSIRNAQILNQVDSMAEPHPSGASYLLPAGTTKSEVIKRADIKTNLEINPTQEFKRIDKTFHFHKTNSFTKCKACVLLKVAAYNVELSEEDRKEAKIHLKNHYDNIKNDRRDYEIRKLTSLQEVNFLLSLGHDGMSKYLSTFPHLNNDNIKTLSDTMKMACSLNLAIVHRNTIDTPYQLHSFWNIDQMSGAKANAVISQLFYSISHCSPIPSKIAIQLDNCASNKCYTLLGAFGHLLLWIPKLTSIYICTSEVGHTHNDIDQKFGVLASALKMNQIYTPQGYTRFAQEKLKGLATNNLLPTTYDFEAFLRTNVIENGQIAKNHYFELTRQEDNTVTMKIARFLRSEKYISSTSTDSTGFKLFKQPPNANEFPKIVPPNAFDLSKHAKLCKAVKGAMNPSDFEELVNLPKFIEENYQPEPFEDVLKRISDKVVAENITVRVSEDPENDLVDKFLKRINKPWEVNQRETTVNADVRPSKEKSSTSKRSASKSASTNDLPAATANKPEKKQRKK